MLHFDSSPQGSQVLPPLQSPVQAPFDITPPVGVTSPRILVQEAAAGHRGGAWRLLYLIIENDSQAMTAISLQADERLIQNLVEFMALGTWAQKPFVVPPPLRTSYARTRLSTLFTSPSGISRSSAESILISDLHDERPAVRETAMYLLGMMGSTAAIPLLSAALHDPLPAIRLQAARALGHTGNPSAVLALLDALHGADRQLGNQIFLALTNLGHVAVPLLLEGSRHASAWMRWHCIRALGEIRDQRALPILVSALNDKDHSVAWMAAKGLALFGKDCIEPVLHLLTTIEITPWLVETSAYVLHFQCHNHADLKPYLEPVIQQMHQSAFRTGTGYAALKALEQLQVRGL